MTVDRSLLALLCGALFSAAAVARIEPPPRPPGSNLVVVQAGLNPVEIARDMRAHSGKVAAYGHAAPAAHAASPAPKVLGNAPAAPGLRAPFTAAPKPRDPVGGHSKGFFFTRPQETQRP